MSFCLLSVVMLLMMPLALPFASKQG